MEGVVGQGPVFSRCVDGAACEDLLPWQEGMQREPRFQELSTEAKCCTSRSLGSYPVPRSAGSSLQ